MRKVYSRREFLRFAGLGATASLVAACSDGGAVRVPTSTPAPTQVPVTPTPAPAAAVTPAEAEAAAEVIVGDVLDYVLNSEEWPGDFGQVKFKLYEAFYDGDMVYHIRTDTSDPAFAQENKLVHVPLLNAALSREDATSPIYFVEGGVDEDVLRLLAEAA